MAEQLKPTHGVMEGGGSYNRHARIPAAAGRLTLPILDEAVRSLALASDDRPVVIADYGSSQGTNSLIPIRAAVKVLRARAGADRPILVVHVDQVANDFNTLFAVLHSDPDCYSIDDANVFSAAIGRSFYELVLPRRYVHLGWSSYAAVWLSRIPSTIPGHFMVLASDGEVRAQFDRQAAEDWKLFLRARAEELAPGGRLVVVLPGLNDDGKSGFEILFAIANEVLAENDRTRRDHRGRARTDGSGSVSAAALAAPGAFRRRRLLLRLNCGALRFVSAARYGLERIRSRWESGNAGHSAREILSLSVRAVAGGSPGRAGEARTIRGRIGTETRETIR